MCVRCLKATSVKERKPTQAQVLFLGLPPGRMPSDAALCSPCRKIVATEMAVAVGQQPNPTNQASASAEAPQAEAAADAPAVAPSCCPRDGCENTKLIALAEHDKRPAVLATIGLDKTTTHLCVPCKADASSKYRLGQAEPIPRRSPRKSNLRSYTVEDAKAEIKDLLQDLDAAIGERDNSQAQLKNITRALGLSRGSHKYQGGEKATKRRRVPLHAGILCD